MEQLRVIRQFRSEYTGEDIHLENRWEGTGWNFKTEFIPNAITNTHISNRAAIVGNGSSRKGMPIHVLPHHRGGILGADAMQVYGCNAVYRDIAPQFLVATGEAMVDEIANSDYCDEHIVYSNAENLLKYPGKFYLVPGNPHLDSGALAAYIACFDGHKQLYLLGFDGWPGENHNNNIYAGTACYESTETPSQGLYFESTLRSVMLAYPEVEFVRVMPWEGYPQPDAWASLPNFRQISFKSFVGEVDL
jgi:hypothetical protein